MSPDGVTGHLDCAPEAGPPTHRGIPPRRAAAIVAGLAGAAAVYVGASNAPFTRVPVAAPTPQAAPVIEHDAHAALKAFEHLEDELVRAYRAADPSHLNDVLTTGSPLAGTARRELRALAREGVQAHLVFRTRSLVVVRHMEAEAVLRQVVVERVRLFTPAGLPLPPKERPMVNTIDWTLRLEHGAWRIHDSKVLRARPLRGS